jgi:hypothetical protein
MVITSVLDTVITSVPVVMCLPEMITEEAGIHCTPAVVPVVGFLVVVGFEVVPVVGFFVVGL